MRSDYQWLFLLSLIFAGCSGAASLYDFDGDANSCIDPWFSTTQSKGRICAVEHPWTNQVAMIGAHWGRWARSESDHWGSAAGLTGCSESRRFAIFCAA